MADPEAIYNWQRLDNRMTTSGQPTEKQLADIHALGVRHIVNLGLQTHEKALPDEAASVSRLGMTYIHIPVDFQKSDRPGLRAALLCHPLATHPPSPSPANNSTRGVNPDGFRIRRVPRVPAAAGPERGRGIHDCLRAGRGRPRGRAPCAG